MAHVQDCRFCGQKTLNHDHDTCARFFGEYVEREIIEHSTTHPTKPIPEMIQSTLKSPEWQWYQEYIARESKYNAVQNHIKKIEKSILKEIRKILESKKVQKKIEDLNTPHDQIKFNMNIDTTVTVTRVPTC